jgi:hypothetical protein
MFQKLLRALVALIRTRIVRKNSAKTASDYPLMPIFEEAAKLTRRDS